MFNNYKKITIFAVIMASGNLSADFQFSDLGKPFKAAFNFFKDGQQLDVGGNKVFSNLKNTSFCNLSTLALVATVATSIGLGTRAIIVRKNRIKKEKELAQKKADREAEELRLAIELSEREKLELVKSSELAQKKALEEKKAAEEKALALKKASEEKALAEKKAAELLAQNLRQLKNHK